MILPITALTAGIALCATAQTRGATAQPQGQSIVTAEATARGNKSAAQIEVLLGALRTSLAEVRMGELAAQLRSKVRDFGLKLESDHTTHAGEIERLLEPLDVTIPTEPSAKALSQLAALTRLSGEEFDAAFVQMTIWTRTPMRSSSAARKRKRTPIARCTTSPPRACRCYASTSPEPKRCAESY